MIAGLTLLTSPTGTWSWVTELDRQPEKDFAQRRRGAEKQFLNGSKIPRESSSISVAKTNQDPLYPQDKVHILALLCDLRASARDNSKNSGTDRSHEFLEERR